MAPGDPRFIPALDVTLPALMADLRARGSDNEEEFGILSPASGHVLDVTITTDRAECERRLASYRTCWPDAAMVVRTVHRSTWTTTRRPEVAA